MQSVAVATVPFNQKEKVGFIFCKLQSKLLNNCNVTTMATRERNPAKRWDTVSKGVIATWLIQFITKTMTN